MNRNLVNRIGKLIVLLLIVGLLPAYAQKKGKEKVNRLPDDLEKQLPSVEDIQKRIK